MDKYQLAIKKLLNNPKFAETIFWLKVGNAVSRLHTQLVGYGLQHFGDHGPDISQTGRTHFPEELKTQLRDLCADMKEHWRVAEMCWPKGTKTATKNKVRQAVKDEFGCGFYG